MNKTFYEVVPADVLPEVKEGKMFSDFHFVIKSDGAIDISFYDMLREFDNGWQMQITGWLRPLPPDTVVVSDLDAVAERVIRKLDEMGRKCNEELFGLPVSPDMLMNTMKEAVKEILKQQDNG